MSIDRKVKQQLEKESGPLSIALFMRAARTSLGLPQEELGGKLGLSRANLCDIEEGRQIVSTEPAAKVARMSNLPEKLALEACLPDQVRKAGFKKEVTVS